MEQGCRKLQDGFTKVLFISVTLKFGCYEKVNDLRRFNSSGHVHAHGSRYGRADQEQLRKRNSFNVVLFQFNAFVVQQLRFQPFVLFIGVSLLKQQLFKRKPFQEQFIFESGCKEEFRFQQLFKRNPFQQQLKLYPQFFKFYP